MLEIRYVQPEDKGFWYRLDKHLSEQEFNHKISQKMRLCIVGESHSHWLLRYNLFWDNTPFCTMLFIDWQHQGKGYGKNL